MKKLIMTVGLPRSGKSTWSRLQGHPVVNPDSIRLAIHGKPFHGPSEPLVWATAHVMVDSLFNAGHSVVILDATNVSRHRREEWTKRYYPIELKVFTTDPDTCKKRAIETGQEYLLPVIDRMAREWDHLPLPEWHERYGRGEA